MGVITSSFSPNCEFYKKLRLLNTVASPMAGAIFAEEIWSRRTKLSLFPSTSPQKPPSGSQETRQSIDDGFVPDKPFLLLIASKAA